MGWRSTLVVMHDLLNDIGKDQTFGRQVEQACLGFQNRKYHGEHQRHRGFEVIEQNHADGNVLVKVHDYTGEVLCGAATMNDLDMLKALADKLGYRIAKKPVKP